MMRVINIINIFVKQRRLSGLQQPKGTRPDEMTLALRAVGGDAIAKADSGMVAKSLL